jgi:two-component system NtrC family sensor kinase
MAPSPHGLHEHRRTDHHSASSLQRRIIAALLVASLLPLGLLGLGSFIVFGRIIQDRTLQLHRNVVESHAVAIELYLAERTRALELAARTHSLVEVSDPSGLRHIFQGLNETYDESFVDLGVISSEGDHLAYVGPYDLTGRNYRDADWFRSVMVAGSHVSDVFLGFRGVPHRIIAVRARSGDQSWVLRATINADRFDRLLQTEYLGRTGDAFLINREGILQTTPRTGKVLDQSPIEHPQTHRGVQHQRIESEGKALLQATAWINSDRWMLVVQQDESEALAPFRQAMTTGGLVVALAFLILMITAVAATRHLTRRIVEADSQKESLSHDLMRSAKLASLGELATGLAHEINNPLAIISAESTNIADLVGEMPEGTAERQEILESVRRCQRQVERGGAITAKMLQFGRHGASDPRPTKLAPVLDELINLLSRQARVRNISLDLRVQPDLPMVTLDSTELEQVLVNLINNSFHALKQGGTISVEAKAVDDEVLISVADDGHGISPENLDKVFQPFFTTKPVGQGTGLGLSVCYGIVTRWGGDLGVESQEGRGTTITLKLPHTGHKPTREPGERTEVTR